MIGVYPREPTCRAHARDVTLALWRVADPGNVGTLIRTADAFGAGVALSDGCADPTRAEGVARVGGRDLPRAARSAGTTHPGRRIALDAHGGAPLAELDLDPPLTFLLGAEREGLPDELVAQSDASRHDPAAGRRRVAQRRRGRRDRALRDLSTHA